MPPLSSLPDEFVEEVLLRLPPDPPASLVRAGLVCKRWCRLVSGAGFRRRFREFHRPSPPILRFLYDQRDVAGGGGHVARFIPMPASFPPHHHAGHRGMSPWDSRHGRVLLRSYHLTFTIVVWDPVTDQQLELPKPPPSFSPGIWTVAVLCAAAVGGGCDHLDCNGGPFLVVLMGTNGDKVFSYVYSSEAGTWNLPAANSVCNNELLCPALVELTTMEDGRLGFTRVENFRLSLWSRQVEENGWAESGFIELMDLLPVGADPTSLYVIGCADSIGVVFLYSNVGTLTVDLKSSRVTKVWDSFLADMFPYVSFYTPGACLMHPPCPLISATLLMRDLPISRLNTICS
ncbi:hypothetical protein HU200_039401 [Digitaria exilis]|uniref:F-box domain-containing protein n=1 Tax=Digitaria exilis TaxID=1010633 RepID=A0A835EHJ0_9POAL|nr:hypothetical protein HU200_039401 [Digitaria exilis]